MAEANAQTQILEKDIARVREDLEGLSHRFDRHLEIYAQNGKELASLKSEVSQLVSAIQNMEVSHTKNNDNQWIEIKQNTSDINTMKIELGKMGVRIGVGAAIGSTLASSLAVFIIEKIFV